MHAMKLLIIETSHRLGRVAIADGDRIIGERLLDEARRHARDLVPATRDLLAEAGWKPRDLTAVIVSRGPGSYTGLRVGIMSAKMLAYATGCKLIGVETFAAIALQALADARVVDVIADAQQDRVYVQRFLIGEPAAQANGEPLTIQAMAEWRTTLNKGDCVIGPGLERFAEQLPGHVRIAPPESWFPRSESLLRIGIERLHRGERDDPFAVEPLYLRASSAEEKWALLSPRTPKS
jgi:tRNA threonylcarbamoyladenosine biosynthesis protein TsaB